MIADHVIWVTLKKKMKTTKADLNKLRTLLDQTKHSRILIAVTLFTDMLFSGTIFHVPSASCHKVR